MTSRGNVQLARPPIGRRYVHPDALTHVELTWIEKKIEYWIRFGRETHEQILDRRRRVLSFAPGSIFCLRSLGRRTTSAR